ncbi:hypothetical protein B0J17DRAFT_102878 [Rhizoctonia solani]|nr:hypothetical protein B0J17DRAFT_102878 [Rhizoctonia solani]
MHICLHRSYHTRTFSLSIGHTPPPLVSFLLTLLFRVHISLLVGVSLFFSVLVSFCCSRCCLYVPPRLC